MNDRRFVLGALTWTIGILLLSYLYRTLITDPRYLKAHQITPISAATQPVSVNR